MSASLDEQLESYLRKYGVTTLAAVRCPETVDDAGLVHLDNPAETELARQLLVEHPHVDGVDRAQRAPTILYFWVRPS